MSEGKRGRISGPMMALMTADGVLLPQLVVAVPMPKVVPVKHLRGAG
jgi:hypothetical protein